MEDIVLFNVTTEGTIYYPYPKRHQENLMNSERNEPDLGFDMPEPYQPLCKESHDAARSPLWLDISERDIADAIGEYQQEKVYW